MHRIDGPGALPGGSFTEGDPTLGTPSTIVTDDWANAVQDELVNAILGAGIALSKSLLFSAFMVKKIIEFSLHKVCRHSMRLCCAVFRPNFYYIRMRIIGS